MGVYHWLNERQSLGNTKASSFFLAIYFSYENVYLKRKGYSVSNIKHRWHGFFPPKEENHNTGIVCFNAIHFITLHRCCIFFTNWRQGPPLAKEHCIVRPALLWWHEIKPALSPKYACNLLKSANTTAHPWSFFIPLPVRCLSLPSSIFFTSNHLLSSSKLPSISQCEHSIASHGATLVQANNH